MPKEYLHNPHAGEILKEEFLVPLEMSQNALAKHIGVPPNRIHAIVNGTRGITAETDLLLCKFFGLSEGYWLRIQNDYALMEAKRSLGGRLKNIISYAKREGKCS
ncbi:MAG: HigA family addiction module antidote protein [Alphaproteobacteria bacterium]|jgi:addiction module HigA family antidote|nr:HigA family addiction module antidote protein [Alphaproteobacteria bacterium]